MLAPEFVEIPKEVMSPLEVVEERTLEIGRFLKAQMMPPGWGFVLMLVNFTEDGEKSGRMTYLSSCDGEAIPTMLREMAEKLEKDKGSV